MERAALGLYSLALTLVQPLLRFKLRKRGAHEPLYCVAVGERFGHYRQPAACDLPAQQGPLVWVHAVSLGETMAAGALVWALRQRIRGMRLLLTHGTATGREAGVALLQTGDVQVWQPWDTREATRCFLQHFRPAIGLLMETEVWPNLVATCLEQRVPLCLVNARMSEKTRRQTARLALLARPAYRSLRAVWAQSQDDAQRLASVGALVTQVTGNVKFDAPPDALQVERGRLWRSRAERPVVMLASSREGEEALWLQTLLSQRKLAASVQWLVVPRHPQRFEEVAALLVQGGFSVSRRSHWALEPDATGDATVWLGDSLGEMALYFSMADAALLGGSFAPLGGQNLIEAAACGCPVVMGPHTFNFEQAAESSFHAGASFRVSDMQAGVTRALSLVRNGPEKIAASQAALQWSQHHRGAVQRTVDGVVALLLGQQSVDALQVVAAQGSSGLPQP